MCLSPIIKTMNTAEAPTIDVVGQYLMTLGEFKDGRLSKLTPVDYSVVQKLTAIPKQFSRREQVLVLRAHGLANPDIAVILGISDQTVKNHVALATNVFDDYGSTIEAIMILKSDRITPLLTEGLHFNRYRSLTPRQKQILDLIAEPDMWWFGNKEVANRLKISDQTVKNHLVDICSTLGVRNKLQAIIYRLFIPNEMLVADNTPLGENLILGRCSLLTPREKEIRQLLLDEEVLSNRRIADMLAISGKTVSNHITSIYHKLNVSGRVELMHVFE